MNFPTPPNPNGYEQKQPNDSQNKPDQGAGRLDLVGREGNGRRASSGGESDATERRIGGGSCQECGCPGECPVIARAIHQSD